jgi:hypothetical protein
VKAIAVILSAYLLLVAFIPCSDHAIGLQDEENVAHMNPIGNHDHHLPHSVDDCSPFCYCHCCLIDVSVPEMKTFDEPISYRATNSIMPIQNLKSGYLDSLFRPPQV